ncbi:MAG: T9SS type A sorting domain-containing protein [Bacteroidota bacterium]
MKNLHFPLTLLLFVPVLAFGQTGPAGVLSSTKNVFWLKADANVYTNAGTTLATSGQTVQQWNDKSGNGKDFTQTTSTLKPKFTSSSMNGFPAVTFDGSDDYLSNLTITTDNKADFFAVVKYPSLSGNAGVLQGSATGKLLSTSYGEKVVGMWVNSSNKPWGRGVESSGVQLDIPTINSSSAGAGQILENQYGSLLINQFINATLSGSVTTDGTLGSWKEFAIGRQGSETWNGDIAEVIAFDVNLNLAQRNIVSNYLSAKYNITINSSNDFYGGDQTAKGDYDFEVAGIGQESDGSNTQFDPSVAGGLGITHVSGLNNGEYTIAGHNLKSGNTSINTDVGGMTGTGNKRWKRIWYIDVTGSGIVTNLKFDLSDGGFPSLTAGVASNYVLLKRAGTSGSWTEITGASVSGDVITFSGLTLTDGYYTLGTRNSSLSPIPVKLVNFTAEKNNNNTIGLHWQTATEINNSYFGIERSADGNYWVQIGKLIGAGNSTDLIGYTYIDKSPFAGLNYYRLRQTDFDDNYELSPVRMINMSLSGSNKLVAYPNPAKDFVTIELDKAMLSDLEVYDISGRQYYNTVKKGSYENQKLRLNISSLPKGVYFITSHGKTVTVLKE